MELHKVDSHLELGKVHSIAHINQHKVTTTIFSPQFSLAGGEQVYVHRLLVAGTQAAWAPAAVHRSIPFPTFPVRRGSRSG